MSAAASDLLLVGAAHVDRIARPNGAFRAAASNPGRCLESIGGAAFNAARALARLGARPHLVSARGGDANAEWIARALEEEGIGDGAVTWLDRGGASYTAILDETGELRAAVADMAIYDLVSPRLLQRRHLRDRMARADALVLDANLPAETLTRLVAQAAGLPVFAIAVSPAKVVRFADSLAGLSALFLSRAEALALTGLGNRDAGWRAIAEALGALGLRRAVVTDGPRPALVMDGTTLLLQAPPAVDAIRDVTGAGDTLAAAALLSVLGGADLLQAARMGQCAAALHIASELPKGSADRCRSLADALPAPVDPASGSIA